jgi:GntR family transcriptional regulator of vanillate catabolism
MRAAAQLRELLFAGAFEPGERLVELELVQRLGVSRSPVRMALAMLEHEGLIALRPMGGHVVCAFSGADIEDLFHLRGVLAGSAARLAAERSALAPVLVAELRDCFDAMEATLLAFPAPGAVKRYFEQDALLDDLIVRLADSPRLKRLLDGAVTVPFTSSGHFAGRQLQIPPLGFLTMMQSHHRSLLDAIERAEGERAENVAREHWRAFSDGLRHVLNSQSPAVPSEHEVRTPQAAGTVAGRPLG